MNLTASGPPASPRSASTPASCRRDEPTRAGARESFERALAAKRPAPRDACDAEVDPPADAAAPAAALAPIAPAAALAPIAPAAALARTLAAPAGAGAGTIDNPTGGARAAIQTALNANPDPVVAPIGGADPAAVWEASVRGPDQLAVDVRAERSRSHGAAPSWGLTIAAPALGAELLARHVPRLNERLRKHGVEPDHVRIESFDRSSDRSSDSSTDRSSDHETRR